MRTRHRTPSLVNMWMLDVFCCALGCVTLLWLINSRQAKVEASAASATRSRLEAETQRVALTSDELARVKSLLANATEERDKARLQLGETQDLLGRLAGEYVALSAEATDSRERLAATQEDVARLSRRVEDLTRQSEAARASLTEAERSRSDLAARAKLLQAKLDDSASRLQAARAAAEKVPDLEANAQAQRESRAAAEARLSALEKELALARQRALTLQGEKRSLEQSVSRLRNDIDNRFAGITLSGKRVLFLVDTSGSMRHLDETTPDANKWGVVRDTLGKVMKSLPDLEKFQVILFSEAGRHLLGEPDVWQSYDEASVDRVTQALAATVPAGNTNMSAAFESAFRYRDKGLDTVYVLSDGLPNVGAGLSVEELKRMTEIQRSEALSKYIRKRLRNEWNRPGSAGRVRINTIGFFYESPDVGAFLWALARENEGSFVGMSKP